MQNDPINWHPMAKTPPPLAEVWFAVRISGEPSVVGSTTGEDGIAILESEPYAWALRGMLKTIPVPPEVPDPNANAFDPPFYPDDVAESLTRSYASQALEQASEDDAPEVERSPGVAVIAAERQRQVEVEGWMPDHDDEHDDGSLAAAAMCYACPPREGVRVHLHEPEYWPFEGRWWKPTPKEKARKPHRVSCLCGAPWVAQLPNGACRCGACLVNEMDGFSDEWAQVTWREDIPHDEREVTP
jgi:hypothetical protein